MAKRKNDFDEFMKEVAKDSADAGQTAAFEAYGEHFRLIAAAPDLLEALQDLTAQIRVDHHADCLHLLLESDEYKAALEAIKKAEGES